MLSAGQNGSINAVLHFEDSHFSGPGSSGHGFPNRARRFGPRSGSIKSAFKHTLLLAVSIQWVKMAHELVVFLFLWVLCRRRTELA